jgi:RimJ/RimL family protein N-acetyltransferase
VTDPVRETAARPALPANPAVPEITTKRLLLRGFRDADREPFAALNADPEVMAFFAGPLDGAASDAMVERIVEHWRTDGHGLWAVERRSDEAFLGFTGIARIPWLDEPEIGWRLARFAWGRGYATKAARAALAWGFTVLGVPEIVSVTTVTNGRSRAVMERLGMHRDPADDFLHPNLPDGHPIRPHVKYRLHRDEWASRSTPRRAAAGG